MRLGTYNPASVNLIVGGRTIQGFGDGTFIEITRNNPIEQQAIVGAKGEYTIVKNNDKSGFITFQLSIESELNTYCDALAGSDSIVPVYLGRIGETIQEIISAPESWIQEKPQETYEGETPTNRSWVLGVGRFTQKKVSL